MSTIKFNQWLNPDNSENYKCRAWVNFNGTGTVAIRASGNVSSITDIGVGNYGVNFTAAMADANYVCHVSQAPTEASNSSGMVTAQTAGQAQVYVTNAVGGALDSATVMVTTYR